MTCVCLGGYIFLNSVTVMHFLNSILNIDAILNFYQKLQDI